MNTLLRKVNWVTGGGYILAGVLVGGVVILFGLAIVGFPDILTRWFLAEVNSGDYFVQAQDVYLDLRGGVKARNVSVYRKGIPGPPFLEARECRILYHLLERPRVGRSRIKDLKVYDGILRPLWSSNQLGANWATNSIDGSGRRTSKEDALRQVDAEIALFNFDVLGVWVEQIKTSLRVEAEELYLSRISGKVGRELHSGTVEGVLAWRQSGHLTGRLTTSFDPHALIPVCKNYYPAAVGVMDRFSFPVMPPRVDLTFEVDSKPTLSVSAKGRFQASNYAYRGVVIGYASMNIQYLLGCGTNWMRIDPFSLIMGGRQARGQVDYDFMAGVADFQASSEVNLAAVLRLAGMKDSLMESWAFEEGARLVAKGRVGYAHPENSEVEARVEGAKIGYKGVSFSNYSFDYKGHGFTHTFSDFRGNAGGGFVSGSAVLAMRQGESCWRTEVKTEIINADTDEFLKLVSTNLGWRIGGKIFGNFDLNSTGTELEGQGQLTIRDALIFKTPLVANLLEKWGSWPRDLELMDIPAEARFSFAWNHDKITSRDVAVESGVLGVAAQGSCGLDGSLDWVVRPVIKKSNSAAGRAIYSLRPTLPETGYSLTGTIERPVWHPILKK